MGYVDAPDEGLDGGPLNESPERVQSSKGHRNLTRTATEAASASERKSCDIEIVASLELGPKACRIPNNTRRADRGSRQVETDPNRGSPLRASTRGGDSTNGPAFESDS